jgi:hypothetical protein
LVVTALQDKIFSRKCPVEETDAFQTFITKGTLALQATFPFVFVGGFAPDLGHSSFRFSLWAADICPGDMYHESRPSIIQNTYERQAAQAPHKPPKTRSHFTICLQPKSEQTGLGKGPSVPNLRGLQFRERRALYLFPGIEAAAAGSATFIIMLVAMADAIFLSVC